MKPLLDVPVLCGSRVRLEPLAKRHVPDLALAAEEDRSSYGFTLVPRAAEVEAYVHDQLARDGLTPFAQVRTRDGTAVGCTGFWDPRTWPGRDDLCAVEIGWTWLTASAQGTGINAEAKFLLLTHAFEALGCLAVEFRTHWHNMQSRAAIERLGAKQDGVLRHHRRMPDGTLRDTVVYSIVQAEWPAVRNGLRARLRRGSARPA